MVLHPAGVDGIRRWVAESSPSPLKLDTVSDVTLGAAFELAVAEFDWRRGGIARGVDVVQMLAARHPLVHAARRAVDGHPTELSDGQVCRVDVALLTDPYGEFFMNFNAALRANGFSSGLSLPLTTAFTEMADNVVQHSEGQQERTAVGLLGYRVVSNTVTFAVADHGRGVLASLRTNPRWRDLTTGAEALDAAVLKKATRRVERAQGDGFSSVHKAIAGLDGRLHFRSGGSLLSLEGMQVPQRARRTRCPDLGGFRVYVACSTGNNTNLYV